MTCTLLLVSASQGNLMGQMFTEVSVTRRASRAKMSRLRLGTKSAVTTVASAAACMSEMQGVTPSRIAVGLRVDERYIAVIECAGNRYLFARRERLDVDDAWETSLRIESTPAKGGRTHAFSAPHITLAAELNMSHNAAFECVDDAILVAYGGQGYLGSAAQRGVFVREAPAGGAQLRWSPPRLVASGDPRISGCIEERTLWPQEGCSPEVCPRPALGFFCEFDGKLSLARFRGQRLLFARANPWRNWPEPNAAGGRHVEVAMQPRGAGPAAPFGRFVPLQFANFSLSRGNNIYFFVVRPLRRVLIALYPAVLGALGGGLFCSTSTDGVQWTRPLRLVDSPVSNGVRVSDWPVDMQHSARGSGLLSIVLHHRVYLHTGGLSAACSRAYERLGRPTLCEYRLPRIRDFEATPGGTSGVCEHLVRSFATEHGPPRADSNDMVDRMERAAERAHACEDQAAAARQPDGPGAG